MLQPTGVETKYVHYYKVSYVFYKSMVNNVMVLRNKSKCIYKIHLLLIFINGIDKSFYGHNYNEQHCAIWKNVIKTIVNRSLLCRNNSKILHTVFQSSQSTRACVCVSEGAKNINFHYNKIEEGD